MINDLKNVNLKLYSYKLDNGLKIYVVPKADANTKYVTFTTKFGSSILEFIPNGKNEYVKMPPGIAHFLEHKVFEEKNGVDPFTVFTNNGADTNANTSNNKTTYLFSGPIKFNKNINYLLDFVQDPYFTHDNVLKEKGIIEQEIKMYDDMPFWKLYDKTMANIFINHPLKNSVAGKVSDINKITEDDLYDCYNTFYHPKNMFLVITGNVNPDKVYNIILKNQSKKHFNNLSNIKVKKIIEPDEVACDKIIIKNNIEIPKLAYALKININNYDINELNLYLNTIFDIKFGSTSIIDEELKNNHLITDTIEYETILADNHIIYMFLVETEKPDYIVELLDKELKNIKINEEDLERKKKLLKSIVQFRSDNIYNINHKIVNNVIKFGHVILDDYKIINDMNIDKVNKIIKDLNFNNKTITIMKK